MDGIFNIYKEKGFTSHDVVAIVRRTIHMKKVGHTGTLDPDAEGVLPVCVGKATKLSDLPGNANISFPGLEGETILLDLDMHGICASTGSACNSDSLDPSHVLLSIGVPEEIGHGSMRFTFGPQNTMEEAKYLCDVLEEVIPRRRAMSCMWLQGQNTARHFSLKGEN